MIEIAIKLITEIEEHGFEVYIVGGFVRDYLLQKKSNDVDITTSATPKDIMNIFKDACLSTNDYGSVTILYKAIRFEITTFRKEDLYQDNRRPNKITYIKSLKQDLYRRDFTINTICMNKEKKILDLLRGQEDLKKKKIRTVGDPSKKFHEDALRILRAVRFCTTLDFSLGEKEKEAILQEGYLLCTVSYERKKEELDKIFSSPYVMKGIALLKELNLGEELELFHLSKVKPCSQVIGIWTMLEVDQVYPFTKNEKNLMNSIRKILKCSPLSPKILYQYGLYPCTVAGELLGIDKKEINIAYANLPIHKKQDLNITTEEILGVLKVQSGPFLKKLYEKLIEKVLDGELDNTKLALQTACLRLYDMIG